MSEATFSGNTIGDKALYLTGVERGKKDERERIIKLLENECSTFHSYPCDCTEQIALIKGENANTSWTSRPLTEEDKEHYRLEGDIN
jgi:hypothetical protein